jgi:hypothetical protein
MFYEEGKHGEHSVFVSPQNGRKERVGLIYESPIRDIEYPDVDGCTGMGNA